MLFYPPGLSVHILQVTPFTINSKPTNAWCLSDDLMYTCKLSQDPGVTKPNARGEVVQECLCMLSEIPIFFYLSRCDHPIWIALWAQAQATDLALSPWRLQLSLSFSCSVYRVIVLGQACNLQLWCLLLPVTAETLQRRDHRRGSSSKLVFKTESIWCESQFSWFLGALPCSRYLSDSLEVIVHWPTSLVRGLLVTIATKPQLKSCVLNLQD